MKAVLFVELKYIKMKKYFLAFAASSMIFTSVISCKDGGEQEANEIEPINEVEQTHQNVTQETKELENTQTVPSGTYTGQAIVVDSQQNEIYVRLNDTTTIELYFSNDTQIMRNGEQVQFDALQEGQTLEVEVEKSGESLKPKTVRIMESQ